MEYVNLNDKQLKYQNNFVLDINKDNRTDLVFHVQLFADAMNQVRRQFDVYSTIYSNLLVSDDNQAPVLNKPDTIPLNNVNGYSWWAVSAVTMIERIENIDGSIRWDGLWKNAVKRYLPIQLIKNNQRFNGWVELSADINNEAIILHRAAVSKYPETIVRAGM
jgi:hypothetical protein